MIQKSVNINGITLSYWEWNAGKEPVLLIHGLADHGLVWSSLGDALAQDYHVVAPDMRGHGDSSKPDSGYTFADAITDLEALLNHLGWEKAHILGHSWGGKLAAIWARRHPQRFSSLILVDPFFMGTVPDWFKITFPLLYRVLPFLKAMGPFSSYEEAERLARTLKQYQGWTPLQQQIFQASLTQNADGTWRSKFVKQARDQIFANVMKIAGFTQPLLLPTL